MALVRPSTPEQIGELLLLEVNGRLDSDNFNNSVWDKVNELIAAAGGSYTVLNGSTAPSNSLGADGDFYIETTNWRIYGPKAAGAWGGYTSLIGPQGATGATGATGSAATVSVGTTTTGAAGSSASVSNSGSSSAAVFDFTIPRGDTGLTGATGAAGTNGTNGTDGKTILNGTSNPTSGTGVDGDFYINTSTSTLFGPKASGTWPSGVSLVGPSVSAPTGAMLQYAGTTAPSGYLFCDGASISTTTYADLFAVLGYTYGGSGSSFTLPDLRGRIPMGAGSGAGLTTRTLASTGGAETHALSTGELATHKHSAGTLTIPAHTHDVGTLAMGAHSHSFTPSGTISGGAHSHNTYATQRTNAPTTGAANVLGALVGAGGAGIDDGQTDSTTPSMTFTGTANNTGTTLSSSTISGSTGSTISANAVTGDSGNNGSGTAHNNVQPFLVLNYIIKT